ncbi:kinase-like domain-containing protein [Mycena crocata]|nr:kinase-like domain-containing protein [Mycena crocata]
MSATTEMHIKKNPTEEHQFNERYAYSRFSAHSRISLLHESGYRRILECLNQNMWTLPVENRYSICSTEPLRFPKAPNGDLQSYLQLNPDVPARLRAKWGQQIAEGISFVHACGVVWADCTPSNMLLDAKLDILLCDFDASTQPGQRVRGVIVDRYSKPGADVNSDYFMGYKLDIYAFGCVFLEILTYNADIADAAPHWTPVLHRGGVAFNSRKPLIDNVVFPPFKAIVENCWDLMYADGRELFEAVCNACAEFERKL